MNAKLIGAVLGTLAFSTSMIARADDAKPADAKAAAAPAATAPAATTPAKGKKTKTKDASATKDAKGGEKSCGADGKSCSGK